MRADTRGGRPPRRSCGKKEAEKEEKKEEEKHKEKEGEGEEEEEEEGNKQQKKITIMTADDVSPRRSGRRSRGAGNAPAIADNGEEEKKKEGYEHSNNRKVNRVIIKSLGFVHSLILFY